MKIYYDKDADLSLIKRKHVAIIGYGSQGHAHANQSQGFGRESHRGLRKDGASWNKARKPASRSKRWAMRSRAADLGHDPAADEHHADVYRDEIEPKISRKGNAAFAHGFNIHFSRSSPGLISMSS